MAVDVDQFSNEPIYRATLPCAQVLEDLQGLGELDSIREKKQARASKVAWGALVTGMLLFFVGNLSLEEFSVYVLIGWSGVLLVLVGITAFAIHARYGRLNLENRRYELASRVVGLLQADIAPDEPVTLELDLRPETHEQKFRTESRTTSGWTVKHYLDPWLSLQGRLLDGTHFRLEMTERLQLRNRTKTNARGKTKFQNKRASDAFLRVRLKVKPERYPHLGRLRSQAQGAVQVITGTRIKDLTVEPDRLDLTIYLGSPWVVGSEPRPPPGSRSPSPAALNGTRIVATAMLSLYQILNLSRALDKKPVNARAG